MDQVWWFVWFCTGLALSLFALGFCGYTYWVMWVVALHLWQERQGPSRATTAPPVDPPPLTLTDLASSSRLVAGRASAENAMSHFAQQAEAASAQLHDMNQFWRQVFAQGGRGNRNADQVQVAMSAEQMQSTMQMFNEHLHRDFMNPLPGAPYAMSSRRFPTSEIVEVWDDETRYTSVLFASGEIYQCSGIDLRSQHPHVRWDYDRGRRRQYAMPLRPDVETWLRQEIRRQFLTGHNSSLSAGSWLQHRSQGPAPPAPPPPLTPKRDIVRRAR